MSGASPLDFEKPVAELDAYIEELKRVAADPSVQADAEARHINVEAEIREMEQKREVLVRQVFSKLTPWNKVQVARHKDRPYTLDYVGMLFDDFLELHGDRTNTDDPAIVGGTALFGGAHVVVLGHQKGRDLRERQLRNFGSARPGGFRKALRLMKLAEKFHRPLVIFVDTPAAEANLGAEEQGISQMIAMCLREMAVLRTPILVAVVGEGGSGGALGIAVGDRIVMQEHAIYSVIPPEGCASILWKDRTRAPEAAEALKLTAQDAFEFELIDEVVPEPLGGAHRDPAAAAATLKEVLARNLDAICRTDTDSLLELRYARFRTMGKFDVAAVVQVGEPDPPSDSPL